MFDAHVDSARAFQRTFGSEADTEPPETFLVGAGEGRELSSSVPLGGVVEIVMPGTPVSKMYTWRITARTTPPLVIGTVEAVDEESAIKKAIEKFEITNPEHQKQLVAQRRD